MKEDGIYDWSWRFQKIHRNNSSSFSAALGCSSLRNGAARAFVLRKQVVGRHCGGKSGTFGLVLWFFIRFFLLTADWWRTNENVVRRVFIFCSNWWNWEDSQKIFNEIEKKWLAHKLSRKYLKGEFWIKKGEIPLNSFTYMIRGKVLTAVALSLSLFIFQISAQYWNQTTILSFTTVSYLLTREKKQ